MLKRSFIFIFTHNYGMLLEQIGLLTPFSAREKNTWFLLELLNTNYIFRQLFNFAGYLAKYFQKTS